MEIIFEHSPRIFGILSIRYLLLAGIPFIILYLLFPNNFLRAKIQKKVAKQKDFLREVGHSLVTMGIFALISVLIIKSPLREYTQVYSDIHAFPLWWIPLSLFIGLFIHDTYFYWMHRLIHHKKLYKHVHLVHHKSTNPTPLAAYSFHFLEAILENGILPILIFLIPMHKSMILVFFTISFIINAYGHLGYEIAPKWLRKTFLFECITTSVHHNLHHSQFKGNYGLYFRFWDRLLGTENPKYVEMYDKIQAQRFHKKEEVSPINATI